MRNGQLARRDVYENGEFTQKQLFDSEGKETDWMPYRNPPMFPGCKGISNDPAEIEKCAQEKLLQFVYRNIRYPYESRTKGIQGMTVVRFVIKKDGDIKDIEVVRSISPDIDEESLRVVNMFPKWIPAQFERATH